MNRATTQETTLGIESKSLLTPAEAAQEARCHVDTIYRAVASGRLAAFRPSGKRHGPLKISQVDLWAWLGTPALAAHDDGDAGGHTA